VHKLIFYGINGIGLGHIARLSVIQKYLAQFHPVDSMHAVCRSSMGHKFFTCPITSIGPKRRDLMKALGLRGLTSYLELLHARFSTSNRKIVFLTRSGQEELSKDSGLANTKLSSFSKPLFLNKC
jgi:hypothetical protein